MAGIRIVVSSIAELNELTIVPISAMPAAASIKSRGAWITKTAAAPASAAITK